MKWAWEGPSAMAHFPPRISRRAIAPQTRQQETHAGRRQGNRSQYSQRQHLSKCVSVTVDRERVFDLFNNQFWFDCTSKSCNTLRLRMHVEETRNVVSIVVNERKLSTEVQLSRWRRLAYVPYQTPEKHTNKLSRQQDSRSKFDNFQVLN